MSTNGWTLERRKRQAQAIQSWKPWTHSTGPRTRQGKAAAARNATKHGARSALIRALARALGECP
jgi:hypothetical protein